MKKTKQLLQRSIFITLFTLLLASCASLQSGIQQVHLGMSKQEVISKMGSDFQTVSMVQVEQGNLEILRFTDYIAENGKFVTKGYYILHFLNNKLVELNYEDDRMRPGRPRRN